MKVKELIEELQKQVDQKLLDPETPCVVKHFEGGYNEVVEFRPISLAWSSNYGICFGIYDYEQVASTKMNAVELYGRSKK